MPDINEYSSAMTIDSATGKVMPKVFSESAEKIVQEVPYHNAVSIRDTNNYDVNASDSTIISKLGGRKSIMVFSTLNQAVTVSILVKNKAGLAIVAGSKNIAAATYGVITSADVPALAEPWQNITLRASCATAPTGGNISTFLEGVKP
jgi:hypothetical protein